MKENWIIIIASLLAFNSCSKEKAKVQEYPKRIIYYHYEAISGNAKLFNATGLIDSSYISNNTFIWKYFKNDHIVKDNLPNAITLQSPDTCMFIYDKGDHLTGYNEYHLTGYNSEIIEQSIIFSNETDTVSGKFDNLTGKYYLEKGYAVLYHNSINDSVQKSLYLGKFDLNFFDLHENDSLIVGRVKFVYGEWYPD